MVDAIVGSVIMVVATSSLFLAIDVAERAMNSAGRYCLSESEKITLSRAGLSEGEIDIFWSQNLRNAATHLVDSNPAVSAMSAQECE